MGGVQCGCPCGENTPVRAGPRVRLAGPGLVKWHDEASASRSAALCAPRRPRHLRRDGARRRAAPRGHGSRDRQPTPYGKRPSRDLAQRPRSGCVRSRPHPPPRPSARQARGLAPDGVLRRGGRAARPPGAGRVRRRGRRRCGLHHRRRRAAGRSAVERELDGAPAPRRTGHRLRSAPRPSLVRVHHASAGDRIGGVHLLHRVPAAAARDHELLRAHDRVHAGGGAAGPGG